MLAGARFIVTPGLNVKTVEICKRYSVAALPGALTPTEVITAWEAGADMVKIFPVDNMGGPAYIQALKAPLPQIDMVPTGGVDLNNLADFLKAGASAVAVGSSLMNKAALKEGRYEVIEAAAKDFLRVATAARTAV
jgi:2-dehydro-3-deoxyphosphogluconate aldolase/(4S)-4-hydroxy-2-oxoglutarate aldolase